MQRPFQFVSPFLLLLCLTCRPTPDPSFSQEPVVEWDLDEIRKRGTLVALVDNNSFSYFIYKGQPMGYEYELLELLANSLGVKLKIKITSGVGPAIDQLNEGEGDILAFPLTVSKPRKEWVAFTRPHYYTHQVLVQRKPEGWRGMSSDELESRLLRNPVDLIGKTVHVIDGTSFEMRLRNLSEELGGDILIVEDTVNAHSESLIKGVALGQMDFTLADHTMARVNALYYPNIDINTVLSVPQQIAWAVRKNSPQLLNAIDEWLAKIKTKSTFMVVYNRYFNSPRTSLIRMKSDYSSLGGDKISPYDALLKEEAKKLEWDWRLLAAIVYEESRFDSNKVSWAGARGLMQLMPSTAHRFGASNPDNPTENIKAGVNYLRYLDGLWAKTIGGQEERLKFTLASYNVGLSHIIDARELAKKYGKDPKVWTGNVEFYLLKKSEPAFYQDPVVVAGYCRCEEPVNYVGNVLERFEEYKLHFASSETHGDPAQFFNKNISK